MKQKFPKIVSVTMTEEMYVKLNDKAKKEGIPKTIILRKLLEKYLLNSNETDSYFYDNYI